MLARKQFANRRDCRGIELVRRLRCSPVMNALGARTKLMSQHAEIRAQLERCTHLARSFRIGAATELELDAAISRLRLGFVDHNATETRLVGPLLREMSARGSLLIDRMLEEHLAEHAELWDKLSGTGREVASRIDDLAEELEAHMAAEERTFLGALVARMEPHA